MFNATADGFRRRAGININIQSQKSFQDQMTEVTDGLELRSQPGNFKFKKIPSNKQLGAAERQKAEFEQILDDIENRRCNFYKMGFKSYQKSRHKKLFADVLKLNQTQMKGTMHIGELWGNQDVMKYLRQNKIRMTKVKLLDRFQAIKKEADQAKRQDQSQIQSSSLKSITSCQTLPATRSMRERGKLSTIKVTATATLEDIQDRLRGLKKDTGKQSMVNEIRYLQRCKERMDRVERVHQMKMLDIS